MLGDAIGRRDVLRAIRAQALFPQWEEVVGPALARATSPDRFERGTLWVTTNGSAWSQELILQKHIVLERLNVMAGESLFEELRTSSGQPRAKDFRA
jgi:predicted nucleic acid-binding Zn ribbon protein